MTCGIYKIENKINGKLYIGQSVNIEKRWNNHKSHIYAENSLLHQDIQVYGIENFELSVIEECSKDELFDKEIFWIDYYNTYNNGYNKTIGGSGMRCYGKKITKSQIIEIKNLLKESNLTNKEIGDKYGVSETLISAINTGYYWNDMKTSYPIRIPNGCYSYVGKNGVTYYRKKDKYCTQCGSKISKLTNGELCLKCLKHNNSKVKNITREELKKLIRENSFLQIGKIFQVTDNAVRRWCDYYNLPRHKKEINNISDEDWELI